MTLTNRARRPLGRPPRLSRHLAPEDRDHALGLLSGSGTIELDSGVPRFTNEFPGEALLLVDEGFVVLRAPITGAVRSVVTCEAGPGRVLLPPGPAEVLAGLVSSRLTVVDAVTGSKLLQTPALADRLVEQLALALRQKQDAIANFSPARHVDRVRAMLLGLAGSYGHVARDGVRIDFPLSHALLAEMIGSSRETVTRAVARLQREGFLDRRGSTCPLNPCSSSGRRSARGAWSYGM